MPNAEIINLTEPLYSVCKNITGPYSQTEEYISQVRNYLDSAGVTYISGTGLTILLDNPLGKPPAELKSTCGVLIPARTEIPGPYFVLELSGNYLFARSKGNIDEIRLPAYQALLNYIIDEQVLTESGTRIEITRETGKETVLEIYMKIRD